jgi:hypothetical protein
MADIKDKSTLHHNAYCIRALALVALCMPSAFGNMIFVGLATGTGAGIGTSNVVLTLQNSGTEQGCVSWTGSTDLIGSGACPGGLSPAIAGGNEKTGSSQTQTRTVTQTGVQSGQSLRVILNVSEPGGTLFTVENLNIRIFDAAGNVVFDSGNLVGAGVPPSGGITINSSFQGQGNLGFGFALDAAQAAAASQFLCTNANVPGCGSLTPGQLSGNANNRVGVAVILTNTQGGNETLSIGDSLNIQIESPEPGTNLTIASALAIAVFFCRRSRSRDIARKLGSASS